MRRRGWKIEFHSYMKENLPLLEAEAFSMCTPFAVDVFVKNSNQLYVPATLLPFLGDTLVYYIF